jgi:hypothetical protein
MPESITFTIQSPRGTQTFTFEKTVKISEVVEAARVQFGFEPGVFELRRQTTNEVLAPERPLISYHIGDGETLLLVPEMGSGV